MKNKFYVINFKFILLVILILSILTIVSIAGNQIVESVIETASSNKLLPIYSVETIDKKVSITFDCAWGADDINDIIDILEFNNMYATFFTVGTWVQKYPEAVQDLSESGMEIGNHSDSHAHVNKMSFDENLHDMEKCNSRIYEITGENVKFYRGPYGEYNNTVIKAAESLNMKVIQWDVDSLDYTRKNNRRDV